VHVPEISTPSNAQAFARRANAKFGVVR